MMALLEIFGLYVAAAAAFYGYLIKTAAPEHPTPVVRRVHWHRPRGRTSGHTRRAH